jgi:hypothetical protein
VRACVRTRARAWRGAARRLTAVVVARAHAPCARAVCAPLLCALAVARRERRTRRRGRGCGRCWWRRRRAAHCGAVLQVARGAGVRRQVRARARARRANTAAGVRRSRTRSGP